MLIAYAAVKQADAANMGQVAAPLPKLSRSKNARYNDQLIGTSASSEPKRMHFTWLRSVASLAVRQLCMRQTTLATYHSPATCRYSRIQASKAPRESSTRWVAAAPLPP